MNKEKDLNGFAPCKSAFSTVCKTLKLISPSEEKTLPDHFPRLCN